MYLGRIVELATKEFLFARARLHPYTRTLLAAITAARSASPVAACACVAIGDVPQAR